MLDVRLIEIMNRLEAATSRLEDMAQATMDNTTAGTNGVSVKTAVAGGAVSSATGDSITHGHAPPTESLPPSIKAFDDLIASDVKKFVSLSEELGGVVADQVQILNLFIASI